MDGIYYTTGLDVGPLRTGVGNAQGLISQLAGGMGSLLGPAIAAASGIIGVTGAVAGFKQAVGAAASAETLAAQLRVLLKDSKLAEQAMADLTKFADDTPFEPEPVAESGRQLLAYGFALKDLLPLLTDAGDLASAMQRPLDEVAGLFGRLKSGQFGEALEGFRRMGVTIEDLKAEGLTFDKGGAFVGSVDKALSAVRAVIQRKFGGTMLEMARTTMGLMSTLAGNVTAVWHEIGAPLLEFIRPALKEMIEWSKQAASLARTGMATIVGAFKTGHIDDLIGLSLEAGMERGVQATMGLVAALGEAIGQGFAMLFEPEFWSGMVHGFRSAANAMAASLLRAFHDPLKLIQDSFTYLSEMIEGGPAGKAKMKVAEDIDFRIGQLKGVREENLSAGNRSAAAEIQGMIRKLEQERADLGYIPRSFERIQREDRFELDSGHTAASIQRVTDEEAAAARESRRKLMESGALDFGAIQKKFLDHIMPGEAANKLKQLLAELQAMFSNVAKDAGTSKPSGDDGKSGDQASTDASDSKTSDDDAKSIGETRGGLDALASDRLSKIGLFVGSTRARQDEIARSTRAMEGHTKRTADAVVQLLENRPLVPVWS